MRGKSAQVVAPQYYWSQRGISRAWFNGEVTKDEVISAFQNWSNQDMAMLWRKADATGPGFTYESSKLAKRGNDVYEMRIRKEIQPILNTVKEFGYDVFQVDDDERSRSESSSLCWTNILFVTLTYGGKKEDGTFERTIAMHQAWRDVSIDFHRFAAGLQYRFGSRIDVCRVWESHQDGYPHVHAMLFFHDVYFKVWCYVRKDRNGEYRKDWRLPWRLKEALKGQARLAGEHYNHDSWPQGFADYQGVQNTHDKVAYLFKYVMKASQALSSVSDEEVDKVLTTQAMIWASNKRAYHGSAQFWYSVLIGPGRLPVKRNTTIGELIFEWVEIQTAKGNIVYRLERKTHNCKSVPKDDRRTLPMGVISHDEAILHAARTSPHKMKGYNVNILALSDHSVQTICNGDHAWQFMLDYEERQAEEKEKERTRNWSALYGL